MESPRDKKIFYSIDESKIFFREPPGPLKTGSRISIYYKDEGKEYPLIIAPEAMLFSFGIQNDMYSGKPVGSKSMCVNIDVDEKTDKGIKSQNFVDIINLIYDKCYIYISKKNRGMKFSGPIRKYEREEDKVQYRLYPKLIISKETGKIWSTFFSNEGNSNERPKPIDPDVLKERPCNIYPAILFDSLYFYQGGVSLQCKISQAFVELLEQKNDDLSLDMSKITL